jgi:hypothetical protein
MHTFKELVDLAKSCANIARRTINPEIAIYFWRLAMDYQVKAAKLNDGKPPDIGDLPIVVVARL